MISVIRSQIGSSSRGRFELSNPASCTAPCMISEPTLWRQVLYTSVPSARCSCVALREVRKGDQQPIPIVRLLFALASPRILPACAACAAVLILVAPGACRPPHNGPRVLVFPLATRLHRPSVFVHVRAFLSSAPRAWSLFLRHSGRCCRCCDLGERPRRLVTPVQKFPFLRTPI